MVMPLGCFRVNNLVLNCVRIIVKCLKCLIFLSVEALSKECVMGYAKLTEEVLLLSSAQYLQLLFVIKVFVG